MRTPSLLLMQTPRPPPGRQLSTQVKHELNPHLKKMLAQISRKALDKKLQDPVTETLQCLEEHGGKDALKLIKAKVPTYTTIFI